MNGMMGGYQPYGSMVGPQQFVMDQMQQYQQRSQMQQGVQLIRVTGMEGAKAYQMPPNSAVPLFDSDNDIMYVKTTDGAGFPTIRTFAFTPVEMSATPQPPSGDYVTREEFESLKEMITGGKQPVPVAATIIE